MADEHYTIRDKDDRPVPVIIRRDKRLRKSLRWDRLPDGSLLVRIPSRLPRRQVPAMLEQIRTQLDKIVAANQRRTDEDLRLRAERINRKHFGSALHWNAIRWVGDMHTRLGSCSGGGPTDGEIRISDKIKRWPNWVVDYVIAHELLHRKHPNHSPAFWKDLQAAYPLTERARGFIRGVTFITHRPLDKEADS